MASGKVLWALVPLCSVELPVSSQSRSKGLEQAVFKVSLAVLAKVWLVLSQSRSQELSTLFRRRLKAWKLM